MLDEFLGTWLDKQKAKRELCKVYKMYDKKKKLYLQSSIEIYCELKNIQDAIAYVLCEYFNVSENLFIMDITWDIYYDYTHYYDRCKRAYEKIKKENDDMEKTIQASAGCFYK